ncbi:group II intron maturase-specific domain-containing protein [Streptomyces mirabilis]|uniref:group II intron maturase-specific domain-containing protein n=1 Tax=Streptomyces mirabilis TaxID=68239 RepID=UPI0036C32DC3
MSTTRGQVLLSGHSPHQTENSKAVFSTIDDHAWHRIVRWIFHKHSRLSRRELRRRFCRPDSGKLICDGVECTGPSSVKVIRYRYRGSSIPTPWTPRPAVASTGG